MKVGPASSSQKLSMLLAMLAGVSCAGELPAPKASIDLLGRTPERAADGSETRAVRAVGPVSLAAGTEVRYRIEPRTESRLRLRARSQGTGTLAVGWTTIHRSTGAASPGQSWEIDAAWPGELERTFPMGSEDMLQELRLYWDAPPGGAALELSALELQEAELVPRPSIVLIVLDTLSARHLSVYGYPLETDPVLAQLASESIVFENCFSNAPWTVPSFMTLMTGLYSRSHQIAETGEVWEQWFLAPNRWTLAEALRAAGYRTAGFVDMTWLTEKFGFLQGFDHYDTSAAADCFDARDNPDGGIRKTAGAARAFLEGLPTDQPAFVFVHAFDVHGPYTVEPPDGKHARGVEPYDMGHTAPAGSSTRTFGVIPTYIARGEAPTGELPGRMRTGPIEQAYDEGIRFVDEELGRFFALLREAGVLERSWVVITADHGETMSDSELPFGHTLLSQDVVHIPLIMRPPGGCDGRRIRQVVQTADLYPTLAELAGIRAGGAGFHGRSLVSLLEGASTESSVVLAETGVSEQAMIVADGWKLVELEPTRGSPPETWISHPRLVGLLPSLAELEEQARRGQDRGLEWLGDAELRRDFFERMPAQGLTKELLERMKAREGFPSFQGFVKRSLKGPFYELYDLGSDPEGKNDLAGRRPDQVEALKKILRREQLRRTEAARLTMTLSQPVELQSEEIQALEALGYGGGAEE